MRQGGLVLEAGHVRSKKKQIETTNTKNSGRTLKQTTKSTAARRPTSRLHATQHVSRIRPCSPASIEPGFVEIGLAHLSQSVKNTNVTHTQTDRQTDRPTGRPTDRPTDRRWRGFIALKAKNGLDRFAPSALPHCRRVQYLYIGVIIHDGKYQVPGVIYCRISLYSINNANIYIIYWKNFSWDRGFRWNSSLRAICV